MILNLVNGTGAKNNLHLAAVKYKIAEAIEKEEFDISILNWLGPLLDK